MRAAVVVLGDLNRSPRIVLHASALDAAGAHVDLVGFAEPGWKPAGASSRLRVWPLPSSESTSIGARGLALCWQLARLLAWTMPRPDLILVQNPPGVPTLVVAWISARLRRARFVIDWHNLTWSMLALRLGDRHPLVTTTSAYERFFSKRADVNLFVSSAMRDALATNWGARGHVFRDRPAEVFRPLEDEARGAVRESFLRRFQQEQTGGVLVVSSTSWSADEDFDLLFRALVEYESAAAVSSRHTPSLIVVITGRGPLREAFERRLADAAFTHVHVHTAWLEADAYPRLLAAADLGLCLHRSSSGLDLPMKVLDMLGAGLPVCALNYGPCLAELIDDGQNGLLFRSSEELAALLWSISDSAGATRLAALRARALRHPLEGWGAAWHAEVRPLLVADKSRSAHR